MRRLFSDTLPTGLTTAYPLFSVLEGTGSFDWLFFKFVCAGLTGRTVADAGGASTSLQVSSQTIRWAFDTWHNIKARKIRIDFLE